MSVSLAGNSVVVVVVELVVELVLLVVLENSSASISTPLPSVSTLTETEGLVGSLMSLLPHRGKAMKERVSSSRMPAKSNSHKGNIIRIVLGLFEI